MKVSGGQNQPTKLPDPASSTTGAAAKPAPAKETETKPAGEKPQVQTPKPSDDFKVTKDETSFGSPQKTAAGGMPKTPKRAAKGTGKTGAKATAKAQDSAKPVDKDAAKAAKLQESPQASIGGFIDKIGDTIKDVAKKAGDLISKAAEEAAKAAKAAKADTPENRAKLAAELTQLKGSATAEDAKAVQAELCKMPVEVLQNLKDKGTKVSVCRESVTDHLTHLKGVQPRGWPPGQTWDSVPGLYSPSTNEVVIATRDLGGGKRGVPPAGNGHGAYNLTVHETMHAYDHNTKSSDSDAFKAARDKDKAKLSAYESQAGEAGREETFAETAARFYAGDPKLKAERPNLYKYFEDLNKAKAS